MDARGGPAATLWLLRIVALAHAVSVGMQPVLAGEYLTGNLAALDWHAANAGYLHVATFGMITVALVYWLGGRGHAWPLLVAVGFLFAETIQLGMGFAGLLAVHIPLGVGIVVASVLFALWTFTSGARTARHRRPKDARTARPPDALSAPSVRLWDTS